MWADRSVRLNYEVSYQKALVIMEIKRTNMTAWNVLQFTTSSREDAEHFVTEYVLDAIERIEGFDSCEAAMFAYGADPETGERSLVTIAFLGDHDQVLDEEQSNWQQYEQNGLLTDWETLVTMEPAELEATLGEKAAHLWPELGSLSAEMARDAYECFESLDSKPAAVDTFPDEKLGAGPLGWWVILHNLTVQLNYTLDEELDAYIYGIEHTLRNFAEYEGEEAVDERINSIRDELDRMEDEVKEGRLFSM